MCVCVVGAGGSRLTSLPEFYELQDSEDEGEGGDVQLQQILADLPVGAVHFSLADPTDEGDLGPSPTVEPSPVEGVSTEDSMELLGESFAELGGSTSRRGRKRPRVSIAPSEEDQESEMEEGVGARPRLHLRVDSARRVLAAAPLPRVDAAGDTRTREVSTGAGLQSGLRRPNVWVREGWTGAGEEPRYSRVVVRRGRGSREVWILGVGR